MVELLKCFHGEVNRKCWCVLDQGEVLVVSVHAVSHDAQRVKIVAVALATWRQVSRRRSLCPWRPRRRCLWLCTGGYRLRLHYSNIVLFTACTQSETS